MIDDDELINNLNIILKGKLEGYSIEDLKKIRNETTPNDGTGIYETITELINEKQKRKKGLGLFSLLFSTNSSNNNNESNLNDFYEQEAINSGAYDKTSFEEEELEEDDYYYEDID